MSNKLKFNNKKQLIINLFAVKSSYLYSLHKI